MMKRLFGLLGICVFSFAYFSFQQGGENMVKTDATTDYQNLLVEKNIDFHDATILNEGEFAEAKQLNKDYMYSLSVDRFMVLYRKYSGLPSSYEEYGGWIADSNHGAGTIEAQYLSALVNTYVEDQDEEALNRIRHYIEEWTLCQNNYALIDPGNDGYFGPYPLSWLETLEASGWCQWPFFYNVAHQICALMDVYTCLKDTNPDISTAAYNILIRYTTFFANRVNAYSTEQFQNKVSKVEYGHFSVQMFRMYLLTGNVIFRNAGFKFQESKINTKLAANEDPFGYLHANTCLPKIISLAYAYLATGDSQYLLMAERGFSFITEGRQFATGNISEVEELHPQYETDIEGFQNCETCCAHNLMELCDLLYQETGNGVYFDYYEKLLYNCILGSIDPQTGMKTYYVTMDSGYYKVYHTPYNAFWCCSATGIENFSKLNQFIYYRNNNGVTVNLFINSQYHDPTTGLGIKQQHNFPSESKVKIVVTNGATTQLKIRSPYWCTNPSITYNGELLNIAASNHYFVLNRQFNVGDVIEIDLPMYFWLNTFQSTVEPNKNAIMYGPLVMSGIIEDIGEISPLLSNSLIGKTYDNKVKEELFYSTNTIFGSIKETENNLEYVVFADNQNVLIKPFYRCHRERYIIYWDIYKTGSDDYYHFLSESANEKTYLIDKINVGNWFSENPHGGVSENGWIGNAYTENNRGLSLGGYMAFNLKVEQGVSNNLLIKHISVDTGYSYDIYLDNVYAYSTTVTSPSENKYFYYKTFAIPTSYTDNKNSVNVKIVCTSGTLTTGIYELQTRRGDFVLNNTIPLSLSANGERVIDTHDILVNKITVSGSGSIDVYGSFNGTNYFPIGSFANNGTVNKLFQYKNVKFVSGTGYNGTGYIYGDTVTKVDPVTYNLANKNDKYYKEQFATVHLTHSGTVRMRINWAGVGDIVGQGHGFVPLCDTMLNVEYTITHKSLNDGLLLYYDFEDINNQIVHETVANKDATVVGDVFQCEGKYGKGLNLAGMSYLEVPQFNVPSGDITLSTWVKYNDDEDTLFQHILDLGNDDKNYIATTPNGYVACAKNGGIAGTGQAIYTMKKNQWYHCVFTVNGKTAIAYINGVEVMRNEKFSYDFANISSFLTNYIGKSHINYIPNLNGIVDEVRIYDYALSKRQVAGLYKTKDISNDEFGSDDYFLKEIPPEPFDIDIDANPLDLDVKPLQMPNEPFNVVDGLAIAGTSVATASMATLSTASLKKKFPKELLKARIK